MSVRDFVKNSILENYSAKGVSVIPMILALMLALAFGLIIYMIYSRFYGGVVYSRSYAVTLIGMTALSCMITLAISSNVVISLGMVGSLSIIRYRTAVKDPMDLLYMFWAVATGITIGAGMYPLAIVAAVIMFVLILLMQVIPTGGTIYVAVIHFTKDKCMDDILRAMGRRKFHIKSKTIYGDRTELAVEVFCKQSELVIFDQMKEIEGIEDVTVIQYNGEYHG